MTENGSIRILIAIENRLYLDMLRTRIELEPDLEVVGEAADAETAIADAESTGADLVLMSSSLPGFADGHASCMLRDRVPETRIVVLADERDQRLLAEGLGCGASGYVTKDCSPSELVDTVRGVARGEVLIPPTMLGPLLSDLLDRRRVHEVALLKLSKLSRRERQVLALVARGKKSSEIAQELVISPETARTHVQNILAKLGVHSRLEAASFVIEHGLVGHLEAAAA
jgi:DNA-binding NarL/FixJ family response regulator